MKLLYFCCIVFLAAGFAIANAKADLRAPQPAPSIKQGKIALHSNLEIVPDPKASEARLQIAQSTLNELRAENGGGIQRGFIAAAGFDSTRTIIAGLTMFLALSVVGVLLARKVRSSSLSTTQKTMMAVILFGGLLGLTAILTQINAKANAGPPGSYRWRNLPQSLTQGTPLAGGIDVEIVPDSELPGGRFRLIMPVKPRSPGEE